MKERPDRTEEEQELEERVLQLQGQIVERNITDNVNLLYFLMRPDTNTIDVGKLPDVVISIGFTENNGYMKLVIHPNGSWGFQSNDHTKRTRLLDEALVYFARVSDSVYSSLEDQLGTTQEQLDEYMENNRLRLLTNLKSALEASLLPPSSI